jgi:glycosyltransferase involved in cell wall biosynthesis
MERRGRVCIVRQTDLYEPPVQREAEALVSAGFDVEVLMMRGDNRPRRTVVNDVEITSLPASLGRSGKSRYAADYAWFTLLASGVLSWRHLRRPYAVVQVNTMPDFLVFAAAVPKLLGARVIASMKEPVPELAITLYGPGALSRVLRSVEQRVLRFADHAFTVTEQMKRRYIEHGASAERITVVLNGNPPRRAPAPSAAASQETFTVFCHGSIEDRYGQDTIVEAAALLREELPELRIVFTGRGSACDELEQQIRRLGLDDIISFEGWVSLERLDELLRTSALGVVAQKASPYSHLVHTNKMVDYWIAGLPVIASKLDAVRAYYGEDVLEYFEPGDAESLAAAIKRLRADSGRRAELIANGKRALAENGWSVQRDVYLGVYDELLRRNGASLR